MFERDPSWVEIMNRNFVNRVEPIFVRMPIVISKYEIEESLYKKLLHFICLQCELGDDSPFLIISNGKDLSASEINATDIPEFVRQFYIWIEKR